MTTEFCVQNLKEPAGEDPESQGQAKQPRSCLSNTKQSDGHNGSGWFFSPKVKAPIATDLSGTY